MAKIKPIKQKDIPIYKQMIVRPDGIRIEGEWEYQEIIRTASNLILNQMLDLRGVLLQEKEKETITEEQWYAAMETMYNDFNNAATHILEAFMPDKELRPDITAEAIKQIEDGLIKEATEDGKD